MEGRSNKKSAALPPGRAEIEHYFNTVESATDTVDSLEYWIELQSRHPLLSKVAVDILVIPVSSAPVERVFSTAGKACIGRRNRLADSHLADSHLADSHLEREVMLKKNKHYL